MIIVSADCSNKPKFKCLSMEIIWCFKFVCKIAGMYVFVERSKTKVGFHFI